VLPAAGVVVTGDWTDGHGGGEPVAGEDSKLPAGGLLLRIYIKENHKVKLRKRSIDED
jgi:hypothetical protein